MLNKDEVQKIVADHEAMKAKVAEAEAKVKSLEDDKERAIKSGSVVGARCDSDEARCLRYFNAASCKDLLDVNVADPRFAKVPDEYKHMVISFKKDFDISRWVAQIFHGAQRDVKSFDEHTKHVAVKNILDSNYGREVLASKLKAWGTTVSGGGAEWIPVGVASSYIEEYLLERALQQRIRTVPMPTQVYDMPGIASGTIAKKVAENNQASATNPVTEKLRLSSVKLVEYTELPEEMVEDSAADVLEAARFNVIQAQKNAVEIAMISGDDDGTHIDTDYQAGAANLAVKIWKGWRRQALANSANGATYDFLNAAADETKLAVLRTRMGKFGARPEQLIWVVGPIVYQQMLNFDNVATVDKMGPQAATVLQGALAAYQGIPIVCSEYVREGDIDATGVNGASGNTQAGMLLVNRTRWYLGQRRPIQIKMIADLPSYDRMLLASYQRIAFVGHTQSATEKSVVYGINIAV